MKILSIRGKNLASLSAEFCLDFRLEPLASAGLFGITGPTGAGKSTLLDALCLALYERTPRLMRAEARGTVPDVAEASVGLGDVRTLLRKGAGDGFAEVEFVGSDGVAYRARWSVRRARGKADGRLQSSEIGLWRLSDGQALAQGKKSETLKLIETAVGLNFEQFTRAVLLAQNDFAAFLKASDDERAELLQTLTGTETFARLSTLAFARHKEEKEKLALLDAQLAALAPLSDEAVAELQVQVQDSQSRCRALALEQSALEQQFNWHRQAQTLAQEQASAQGKVAEAEQAWQAAQERRAYLDEVEAVQSARPLRQEVLRLEHSLSQEQATASQAQQQLLSGHSAVTAAEQALQSAQAQRLAAEQAWQSSQPELDAAKQLDAQIQTLLPWVAEAEQARDQALTSLRQQQQSLAQLEQQQHTGQARQQALTAWLEQEQARAPLAEQWPRWQVLLQQAAQWAEEQRTLHGQIQRLSQQEQHVSQQLAQQEQSLAQKQQALTLAQQQLTQASAACAAFDALALAERRETLSQQQAQLQQASQAWANLQASLSRRDALAQQRAQLHAETQQLAQTLAEGQARLPGLQAAVQQAEKSLHSAEQAASASVQALRAELAPGDACPVCGALEHPYAHSQPVVAGMLASLRQQVAQCRHDLQAAQAQSASLQGQQSSQQRQSAALEQDWQAQAESVELSQAQWQALAGPWAEQPAAERSAALERALAQVHSELAQLGQQEQAQRQALANKDAAQAAANRAQQAWDTQRQQQEQQLQRRQQLSQDLAHQQHSLTSLTQQLAQHLDDLNGAFVNGDWRTTWQADAAAFAQHCQTQVQEWQQQNSAHQQGAQQLETLARELQTQQQTLSQAQQHGQQLSQQASQRAENLHSHRQQRAQRLAGRPVAEVEAALQQTQKQAEQAWQVAQQQQQLAQTQHARQQEALQQAQTRLAQTQSALAEAWAALNGWLESWHTTESVARRSAASPGAAPDASTAPGLGLTASSGLQRLDELLTHSPDWQRQERTALQQLHSAIGAAQAVLAQCQSRVAQHGEGRPGELTLDEVSRQLEHTRRQLEQAQSQLHALQLQQAQDQAKRQQAAQLLLQQAQQTARTRVWAQLNDLIGSADGKKFRNFAQQLTLDILLSYANRHLETLSRRYRLERVQDSLALLVVDQDMGDEVRSVHSLSGGESFLVSLALALGLASLSSHRVKVESLFIDEGFGSLDADALAIALSALDKLQAQGRKVGIISHVQDLNERLTTRIQVSRKAGGRSVVGIG